mmetsp:Transcript_4173/g.8650  ORF Transcript_4173/g.8650 Transcript_4173/m.8650 type:complete len:219 (+) Transcript_4173:2387-3043(+)
MSAFAPDDLARASVSSWWYGKSVTLPHLTLVVDEAVELWLAKALVDIGVSLRLYLMNVRKLASEVEMIVAGTGLDRLESMTLRRKIGSDPALTILIVLSKPNLDNAVASLRATIKEQGEIKAAIEEGVYSRVLATNSRMLFRGVIPIVRLSIFSRNLEVLGETLEERLKSIGTIREVMDYAFRYYLAQNTVGRSQEKAEMLNPDSLCLKSPYGTQNHQ